MAIDAMDILLGEYDVGADLPPVSSLRRGGQHSRSVPTSRHASASRPRVMALTVVDQAASSASNFGVAFLIAHYSNARVLGVFAIVSTTYILTQGLVRSLTSDCLLTRHDNDDLVMERYERAGFLAAIVCAIGASILILALSTAFSGNLRLTFVILALSFPLMACQDYARYVGISRFNPMYAVWLDVAWTVLFVAAFVVLRHQGHVSMPWIYAEWSVTGAAVGLYTLWNHLSLRSPRQLVTFWFRSEHAVGLRFGGQWLLVSSWTYVAIYLFTLIFTLAVIGQFKLAQVAFGPIGVLTQGVATAMVALAARYFQVDVRRALRFVLLAVLGTAAICAVWTAITYSIPVHTLTKLWGPTWPAARKLVPLMGLAFLLASTSGAVAAGIRSLRAAKENLRLAIAMVPVLFAGTMIGGVVWGVQGALAALCLGYFIYTLAGWVVLTRVAHRHELKLGLGRNADEIVEEMALTPAAVGGVAEPVVGPIADANYE